MDVARARSPPASLGRRPIGPRSPGKPGSAPKSIIPFDLSARLQEDVALVYADSPAPSSSRAASPAFSIPLADAPAGHHRTFSQQSARPEQPELAPKPEPKPEDDVPEAAPQQAASRPPSELRPDDDSIVLAYTETDPDPAPEVDEHEHADASSDSDEDESPPASPRPQDGERAEPPAPATIPPPEPDPAPPTPRTDGSRPPSCHMSVHSRSSNPSRKSVRLSVASIPADAPPPASAPAPGAPSARTESTPASTRASTPAFVRVIPKRPPLQPPPALNFEVEPIPWKGMTLEAAQWTFTSEQLQETVSRAIRHSASESFIRVVPTHTFDVELPRELERLDSLKATTQAQYRFNMHRRTMLLQSLAALSQSQYPDGGDGEALYNLTTQLAELTVACDRLMETLVRIADQRAQIQQVQDLHIASALSMALRKLNASYAKRAAELQEARAQNEALNAELEEAWSMAQDMAQEMDDLDNFDLAFSDEDDEEREAELLEAEIYGDMDRMSTVTSVRNAEVLEITGKAVATKAMLTTLPNKPGDRASRVYAAKKRSSRASKASLRIPKTPTGGERAELPDRSSIYSIHSRRSRSKSMRRRSERNEATSPAAEDVPEVPVIRIPDPAPKKEGSFLEMSETRPVSPSASAVSEPPPLPPAAAETTDEKLQGQMTSSPSEDVLPTVTPMLNPPPSPTFGQMNIPTIALHEEPRAPQPPSTSMSTSSSWRPRKLFSRRVQSMQPPAPRAVDDTATAPLKRSTSEIKQFDGWPFLGSQKAQRFSVPVLSVIQPRRSRSSTDSAPADTTPSRPSSSSTR
ncbi:hypothetical protein C8Q77DRAFT_1063284 [Trametes polyzona]|nr:hypothetical protein C8Q77DRAFT_1063284 [Trametes polyzona]